MASTTNRPAAYAGSPPGNVPLQSVFDFTFGQPFQTANDFTPPEHALPRIEPARAIFVDNKSGMYVSDALEKR